MKPAKAGGSRKKNKLDARDYAGIWSDDEYMDADELVDAIHNARHFNARQQAARQKARQAIEAMRRQSEQNGNDGLTLDDINDEILQARATRKATV